MDFNDNNILVNKFSENIAGVVVDNINRDILLIFRQILNSVDVE